MDYFRGTLWHKLERYCSLTFFCFESYLIFLWINIVNNLKLVAGFTFISFSLRLARNTIHTCMPLFEKENFSAINMKMPTIVNSSCWAELDMKKSFITSGSSPDQTIPIHTLRWPYMRLFTAALFLSPLAKGAPTEEKMQKGVDQVADSCDSYDLTIYIKKTEVVYQPAPGKPYKEPTITVKVNDCKW